MSQKLDFENENKWGAPMDKELHLKTYKNFLYGSVITVVVTVIILALMAAFLV